MCRLTRDRTAEPVSRDQILRRERGTGKYSFSLVQLTWLIASITNYTGFGYVFEGTREFLLAIPPFDTRTLKQGHMIPMMTYICTAKYISCCDLQ